jgi:hypothetical protein
VSVEIRPLDGAVLLVDDSMPPKLDPDVETKRLNLVAPTWRRQQPDLPNISEAIRRLVDTGLEATSKKGKK